MDFTAIEAWFGVKASHAVAGIIGAIASLTFEEKITFGKAITYIFVGGSVAGYSTYAAQQYFEFVPAIGGFAGFVLGILSIRLVSLLRTYGPKIIFKSLTTNDKPAN